MLLFLFSLTLPAAILILLSLSLHFRIAHKAEAGRREGEAATGRTRKETEKKGKGGKKWGKRKPQTFFLLLVPSAPFGLHPNVRPISIPPPTPFSRGGRVRKVEQASRHRWKKKKKRGKFLASNTHIYGRGEVSPHSVAAKEKREAKGYSSGSACAAQ